MPSSFTIRIDRREPFAIDHRNWSKAVDRIWSNRPLKVGYDKGTKNFIHPWHVSMSWSVESSCWVCTIKPGFVRGAAVEASTPTWFAKDRTLGRLGVKKRNPRTKWDKDDEVDAYLSENPYIPLKKNGFVQVFGADGLNYSGYAIPKYFHDQGVPIPTELRFSADGEPLSFEFYQAEPVDESNKRMLFATDLTLSVPRPVLQAVPLPGALAGNDSALLGLTVEYADARETPPSVFFSSTSPALPDANTDTSISAYDALTGVPQPTHDYIHLARIWMMGPRGKVSDEVGMGWTPVVQHFVFWNLDYTIDLAVTELPAFYIMNPVAPFVSGAILGQQIVDSINGTWDQVISRLNNATIKGTFWTV